MENLNGNPYTIKWVIIVPVSGKFNRNYISAFKKAGFNPVGWGLDVFANYYNSNYPVSVKRITKEIQKLSEKISSYKRKKAILSFTITDKQFGLIGNEKKVLFAKCKVPSSLGTIPVTYE